MGTRHVGEFEFFVLSAILRLGDEAYGVSIRREIEARTDRSVAIGAVYTTLHRLEAKGLVQSWHGQPTAERGGRAKRYYQLDPSGRAALKRTYSAMKTAIGPMVRV